MKKWMLICAIILMCTFPLISSAQEIAKSDSTKKDSTNSILMHLHEKNAVLSSNAVELLLKGPNIMYEQVINGKNGITAKLVYDVAADVNMIYLESSYRWYIWQPGEKRLLTGLAVGPYLKITQQLAGTGKFTFGLGGEIAYKWIWKEHFEFEPGVVFSYPYIFDLHLGFGYAF